MPRCGCRCRHAVGPARHDQSRGRAVCRVSADGRCRQARAVDARRSSRLPASAILCHAIGNEIPAPMVRWLPRAGRTLPPAVCAASSSLSTLVRWSHTPTTRRRVSAPPFLDLLCFNCIWSHRPFRIYLARLQSLAGDRPLIIARSARQHQAHRVSPGARDRLASLQWRILHSSLVTDEWQRGEYLPTGPGPSAATVSFAAAHWAVTSMFEGAIPTGSSVWLPPGLAGLPGVVVCSHNGGHRIGRCCEAAEARLSGAFELIVVIGSTDGTGQTTEARHPHHPGPHR
jgi:hypothetical protein